MQISNIKSFGIGILEQFFNHFVTNASTKVKNNSILVTTVEIGLRSRLSQIVKYINLAH
ncbi:MAG: hypothetical protein RMY34_28845 [Aulosira sp. DedQUE10]|nr:hypothetical protein [Aulosira sp. DedQUE10]